MGPLRRALRKCSIVGFSAGLIDLGAVERRWLRSTAARAGRSQAAILERSGAAALPAAVEPLRLGMLIAAAIGLHNFSEGLAIGVSAQAGEIALASTLIVGFALHNATEGFGIIGPLGDRRPIAGAGSPWPASSRSARWSWAPPSATA